MPSKKLIIVASFVFITSTLYSPIFAHRAQAWFLLTTDIKVLAKTIADGIAMATAQRLVDNTVRSTVNWAQSGFDGNPAYVTDPQQFFLNVGDTVAGDFIGGASSTLSFLCSPFQTKIRLALRNAYLQEPQYSCSLTGVVQNVDAFYNNFSQGGWDAWFAVTQTSGGNPYDAYLEAKLDLDSRIANTIGLKQDELNRNQGFLSWKACEQYGPPQTGGIDDPGRLDTPTQRCIKEKTLTPGVTIKEQLDKVLPSGMQKLITVNHVEQLVTAFANGLLNRYVFGSEGLFNRRSHSPTEAGSAGTSSVFGVDIDGDGINDLIDTNNDYEIDTCVYGNSLEDCAGSKSAPPTEPVGSGPMTYDRCVASCNAAASRGIDSQSCIAASCAPLLPAQ